jgi:hypothetical protein
MIGIAPAAPSNQVLSLVSRPLRVPQFALVAAVAVLAATLYCQIYCLIAFQPTHRMPMPLSASLAWAIGAVAPWLACLELAKRRRSWTRSSLARGVAVGGVFVFTAALAIILELGLDQLIGIHETRPLPMQIAAQLPAAALTASLLWLGPRIGSGVVAASAPARESVAEILAMAATIDWIVAAGNYVEIHSREGVTLHRATMREVEQALDAARFRRIHRSAIVNLDAVVARVLIRGAAAVRLTDGTILKIGSRYRTDFA